MAARKPMTTEAKIKSKDNMIKATEKKLTKLKEELEELKRTKAEEDEKAKAKDAVCEAFAKSGLNVEEAIARLTQN